MVKLSTLPSQKSHEMTDATTASVTVEGGKVWLLLRPGVHLIGCSLAEHRWDIQVLPSATEQNVRSHHKILIIFLVLSLYI